MKASRNGICIRVVATLLTAVLFMSLCPVIPSASAAGETYTATFDLAGFDGWLLFLPSDVTDNKITFSQGEIKYFPSLDWDPARLGSKNAVLVYWEDSNGDQYKAHEVIPEKNETYKARLTTWPGSYYTLKVTPGEHFSKGVPYIVTEWNNFTVPALPEDYAPESGYNFAGWRVLETGEFFGLADIENGVNLPAKDYDEKTLEAVWVQDGKHIVAFDAGVGKFNGIFGDSNTYLSVVNDGESVYFPFAVNQPKDDIYLLEGWKSDDDPTVYAPGVKTPSVTKDVVYRANWGSKNISSKVKVTVRDSNIVTSFYYYTQGPDISIPSNPFGEKPGKEFAGWSLTEKSFMGDSNGEVNEGETYTLQKSYSDEIILTAKWADIYPDYRITYHFNDPDSAEDISAGNYVYYSNSYRVTIQDIDDALYNSSKFDKGDRAKGCVFAGWSTTPDGSADPNYAAGKTVTLTGDLDLYAVWEKVSFGYTVKYHFRDKADGEDVETTEVTGTAGLDEPIPYDTDAKTGSDGKAYAFDSVAEEKIITQVDADNVIDVYYYIDTLSDEKDSQSDSDGIPDIYQKQITYKVNNGTWDGHLDQINEIVTLRDENGALSLTGTAELEKVPDETKAYGDPGMSHYLWDTPDDARPTTVSYNDSGVYILDFFNADDAVIIYPQPVVADYDGEWHTFEKFVVHDYQGNVLSDVTVTWKAGVKLPDRAGRRDGTPEGGDEVNLETVLNNAGRGGWRTFFIISGLEGAETKHAILEGGTITINPAQVTVQLEVDSTDDFAAGIDGKEDDIIVQPSAFKYDEAEQELIIEYVFDGYTHTVELGSEDYKIEGLIGGDEGAVKLSPDGDVILSATYVTDPGNETTFDLTEDLTFYQDGEETSSYEVKDADSGGAASGIMTTAIDPLADGEEEVTGSLEGKTINKITVRIVRRPVTYWTFGGTRIFDGNGIPSDGSYDTGRMNTGEQDPEKKDKYCFIAVPKYEEIYLTDGSAIDPTKRGFVIRNIRPGDDCTSLNHRPWNDEVEIPVNAGIINCREGITKFEDGHDYTKDYDIDYKLGYFTIYPQSITDNTDPTYHDVTTYISDDIADYDKYVVEYTYHDREAGTAPTSAELPAFYTGVKLVNGPAESYTAPYKFEDELLRNENNAPGYRDLVKDTDYTVTYQRKNAAGEWEDTDDFSTPGTIQVTYTGIGNYRNRITREYVLTSASEPGPGPGGGGPSVGTDDHYHYAYIIGRPGGIVDPNGKITRAEIATIIFRLLKEDVREKYWSKTNTFPDVEPSDWYNNAISTLQNLGIVGGRDDGLFHPDDPITRAEMAAMMSRLYDYDLDTGEIHTKFDDVNPDVWYARYVAAAEELGLFYGYPGDTNFYPDKDLTRAEAMTVYNRLLGRKPHRDGLLPESQMVLWPDNMDTSAWYYADVQEATNSHTCDLNGTLVDGERFERWLAPLPVRDWAALESEWSEAYSGYDGHDVN